MSRTRNQRSEVSEPILAYVATGHPQPSQGEPCSSGRVDLRTYFDFSAGAGASERT